MLCLLPTLPPLTSQRSSYVTAHSNAYVWVGCACRVDLAVFRFLFSAVTVFHRLSLTHARNRIYLIMHCKSVNFKKYFSKMRKSETAQTENACKGKALYNGLAGGSDDSR